MVVELFIFWWELTLADGGYGPTRATRCCRRRSFSRCFAACSLIFPPQNKNKHTHTHKELQEYYCSLFSKPNN